MLAERGPRWSEMTPRARRAIAGLAVVQIALAVAAWTDLARRRPEDVRGSKRSWALAVLVNFFGPIAYFRWGRRPAR